MTEVKYTLIDNHHLTFRVINKLKAKQRYCNNPVYLVYQLNNQVYRPLQQFLLHWRYQNFTLIKFNKKTNKAEIFAEGEFEQDFIQIDFNDDIGYADFLELLEKQNIKNKN